MGVFRRYYANPGFGNCNLGTQIFRYLAGTLELGIRLKSDATDELVGYTDSDWAALKDERKSTGRYVFLPFGGSASHQSKQQASVSFFLTEEK